MLNFPTGKILNIQVEFKSGGLPNLLATGQVQIRRTSDNFYLNGTTFDDATPVLNAMTKVSDTEAPGFQFFNTPALADDSYVIQVSDSSATSDNQIANEIVVIGGQAQDLENVRKAHTNTQRSVGVFEETLNDDNSTVAFKRKRVNKNGIGINVSQFNNTQIANLEKS